MKPISFDEMRKIELEILVDLADYCDKKGYKYFLAYGTLIGAIRHKGFIPWDDDIDIYMPREDYDKIIKTFNEDKKDGNYYLVSPTDKISKHSFVKVIDKRTAKLEYGLDYKNGYLGVDVDIFPLDGMPQQENEYHKWYDRLYKVYQKHTYAVLSISKLDELKTKLKTMANKIFCPSVQKCLKKAENLHKMYPYNDCEFVGCTESCYCGRGNRGKKEWYEDFVEVDFEGYKFKAPKGYHENLTAIYGDYMKLPPVEKQVTHHKNNVFWIDQD